MTDVGGDQYPVQSRLEQFNGISFELFAAIVQAKFDPEHTGIFPYDGGLDYVNTVIGSTLVDIEADPSSYLVDALADVIIGVYNKDRSQPFLYSPFDNGIILIDTYGDFVTAHGNEIGKFELSSSGTYESHLRSYSYSRVISGARKGLICLPGQSPLPEPSRIKTMPGHINPEHKLSTELADSYRRANIPALVGFQRAVVDQMDEAAKDKMAYTIGTSSRNMLDVVTAIALEIIDKDPSSPLNKLLDDAIFMTYFQNPEGDRFIANPWSTNPQGGILQIGNDGEIVSLEAPSFAFDTSTNTGLKTIDLAGFDHMQFLTGQFKGMVKPSEEVSYTPRSLLTLAKDAAAYQQAAKRYDTTS